MRSPIVTATLVLTASAIGLAATVATPIFQDPQMESPSAHHKRILEGVGTWKGTMTSFMPGMSSDPVEAHEVVEAIGKFWTRSKFECDFMGPYVGTGVQGYSAAKGKYIATWSDSMSSFLAMMEGEFDEEKDLLIMRWDAPDMTGKVAPHRFELKQSKDHYVSTFYTGDTKTMVLDMKRVKSGGK